MSENESYVIAIKSESVAKKKKNKKKKSENEKGKKVKIGEEKKEEEEKSVKLAPPFELTPSKLVINPRGSLEVHIKNVSAMRQEMLIRLQSVRLRLQSAQICENLSLVHRVAAPGATVSVRITDSGVFCGFELEEHAYSKPKLPEGFFHVEARSAEPKVKERHPETYVMVCDYEKDGVGCNKHLEFETSKTPKMNGMGVFVSDLSTTVIMEPETKSYKEQRDKMETFRLAKPPPKKDPLEASMIDPPSSNICVMGLEPRPRPQRDHKTPARTEESLRKRVEAFREVIEKWEKEEKVKKEKKDEYLKKAEEEEKERTMVDEEEKKKEEAEEKKRERQEMEKARSPAVPEVAPVAPVQVQTPPPPVEKKKKKKKKCTIS